MVLFLAATSMPLAHIVVSPSATCADGVFRPATGDKLHLHSGNLHCVVVVNGGGRCMWRWRYIHMKPALTLEQLALCGAV